MTKTVPRVPAEQKQNAPAQDKRALKKLELAAEAGKAGNYKLSLEILEKLISGSRAPPEAWLLLGRTFHSLGDFSRAIAAFDDYLTMRPKASQGCLFMGRTYLAAAMPQRAIPFLTKAHSLHPRNTQITALLATAHFRARHSKEAVELFQEAVEQSAAAGSKAGAAPVESGRIYRAYLNALLTRGVRLCRAGEYDLGSQMLRFVLENGKKDADGPFLRLELGRACRENGFLEEALEHYSAALKFAPGDRRIRWSRVSILMALGKNDEARQDIEKIRSQEPGVPELPWNSGIVDVFMIRSFLDAGEWRPAIALCKNFLRSSGTEFEGKAIIHALCAEAMRNLRDYRGARFHLESARKEEPAELQFWYADILLSWEQKDWRSLAKALRAAKKLGGEQDILNRFTVLHRANTSTNDEETLSVLQNAVKKLGPEPELMFALAGAYLKLGLYNEAKSWYTKTITLKEDHEAAWLGRIAAQEALLASASNGSDDAENTSSPRGDDSSADNGGIEELEALYNGYLERWPDNFAIRRERALFLIKICEYTEAAAELEKLLLREPSNPSLRRVLAYAYRKTGRYREAAVFLKALLRQKTDDIELLLEYCGCLERAGGIRYALEILESARGLFKKSTEIALALGILNYRIRKIEAAFDFLREAASWDTRDPRPYEWMAIIAKNYGNDDERRYYEREAQRRKNSAKTRGGTVAESKKTL